MASEPRGRPHGQAGDPRIVIAGAGSVGCFVGGLLAAAGRRVTLLARPAICEAVQSHGLGLSDFAGLNLHVPPASLTCTTDSACLATADLVLVTVKTGDSADIAGVIAAHAPVHAPVVSLQNGLQAIGILRQFLPGHDLRAGMVPFNVVPRGFGTYHRATSGDIRIERGPVALADLLSVPGLAVMETPDITAIQWGKLLLNLINASNALSGLTIRTMLLSRDWRRLIADQIAEGLRVLAVVDIAATPPAPVPSNWLPAILRLPTWAFRLVAARMLSVDPTARMSMSYDLAARRRTEIDAFQGAIIDLGARHGVATPISIHIAALIREAEAANAGSPGLGPADLRPA